MIGPRPKRQAGASNAPSGRAPGGPLSGLTISSYISYARRCDPDALIVRARQLGVDEMSLYFAAVPGYEESFCLDPGALGVIVGRLDDAGIRVPAMMNWLGRRAAVMRAA